MEANPEAGGLDVSMSLDGALCAVGVGFLARFGGGGGNGFGARHWHRYLVCDAILEHAAFGEVILNLHTPHDHVQMGCSWLFLSLIAKLEHMDLRWIFHQDFCL